jgi:hypothetical protein
MTTRASIRTPRIRLALLAVAVVIATVAACGSGGDEDESRTHLRVLDSTFTQSWETMEDTGVVYRMEIVSPLGADTIRNVIPPEPIAVGDTLVVGLMQVAEDSSLPRRQIFRLRLGEHRVETTPLPDDVWSSYQDVLVSPDGRYVAYVGEDTTPSNPGTYGVVRNLATRELVVKGPGGGGCDCDDDLNHARWFPPDSFEIAVAHANRNAGWQRISGRASTGKFRVDTLTAEPDWH